MKTPSQHPSSARLLMPLAALLIIFSAGCRKDEDGAAVKNLPPEAESGAQKLVLYTWTDYISPDSIELFTRRTGIEVEYQNFEATEELRAMLESAPGEFDVIIADEMTIAELADLRLIRELNHDRVPLISNLDPRYLDLSCDPGNRYSLPYLWGSTLIAYRSDKVDLKSSSWDLFWDPQVKGKAVMLDEMEEVIAIGLARNGDSINSSAPADLDEALESLSSVVRSNQVTFGGIYENLDRLLNSEILALHCYSGDAAAWAEKDDQIKYFLPREGARLWVDNFAIPRDTQRSDLAHQFINFMLEAEPSAMNSNYLWYGTPNREALALLDEELLSDEVIFPPEEVLARCEFLKATTAEREKALQIGMRRLQQESRESLEIAQKEQEDAARTVEAP